MLEGKNSVKRITEEFNSWTEEHGIKKISEIRGKALNNLKAYDEMKFEPAVSTAAGVPCRENCSKCVTACMYQAIVKKEASVNIDRSKCTGCGLCTFICPENRLKLDL
ncbi:MAG: 4Fe-4S binding protein [Firmicutes bacterium]|nr:4Fe-4S binding protein [Bacillota bacterium]